MNLSTAIAMSKLTYVDVYPMLGVPAVARSEIVYNNNVGFVLTNDTFYPRVKDFQPIGDNLPTVRDEILKLVAFEGASLLARYEIPNTEENATTVNFLKSFLSEEDCTVRVFTVFNLMLKGLYYTYTDYVLLNAKCRIKNLDFYPKVVQHTIVNPNTCYYTLVGTIDSVGFQGE